MCRSSVSYKSLTLSTGTIENYRESTVVCPLDNMYTAKRTGTWRHANNEERPRVPRGYAN